MTGKFPNLFRDCVLWAPLMHSAGVSGDIDEFPIIPSGVIVTNNGTFTKTDLGNNKSVLNFDGSTNYISLTDSTSWDIWDADFTICCWVKIPDTSSIKEIFKQSDGTNWVSLYIASGASGGLYLQGRVSAADNFNYVFSSTPSAGTWMHLTYVRSGSSAAIGYKNGEAVSVTVNQAWRNTTTIAGAFVIGNSTFKDNLKDLLIYKGRALTQAEIKLIMNRTHPSTGAGMIPGPYDYWKLGA